MIGEIWNKFEKKKYTDEEAEELIFNELLMEERNNIAYIFDDDKFVEFQKDVWDSTINEITSHRELPNIAILLNNKLVEVLNYFRAKDVSFYQDIQRNSLARLVLTKIISIYNEAYGELDTALQMIDELDDADDTNLNIDEFKEIFIAAGTYITSLFKYQKIADRNLWKFDIEKDIVSCIMEEFLNCENKGKYVKQLEIYIEDLKKLRLKDQVNDVINLFLNLKKFDFPQYLNKQKTYLEATENDLVIE